MINISALPNVTLFLMTVAHDFEGHSLAIFSQFDVRIVSSLLDLNGQWKEVTDLKP